MGRMQFHGGHDETYLEEPMSTKGETLLMLIKTGQIRGGEVDDDHQMSTISITSPLKESRANGVFVVKVKRAEQATKLVCLLNLFFNSTHKYPIRIFSDFDYTNETLNILKSHAIGADLEIIVDTKRWRELPPTLNQTERIEILKHCKNFTMPEIAVCSKSNRNLGYLYMGYWRYMNVAD